MNTPRLETERLILRKFAADDIAALYRILGDREVNAFLPWFPLKSIEEARALFETRYAAAYEKERGYLYAVCLKEDDCPIGYVTAGTEGSYDLGYGLRKEFWGRGIVTEAGRAVIDQVRRDGLPFITATHDVNNPRSGAVMRRLGMTYRYSYEEQWQPKDILAVFRMYQLNFDGSCGVFRQYWDNSAVRFVEKGV